MRTTWPVRDLSLLTYDIENWWSVCVLTVHPRRTSVELRVGAARVDSEHFDVHAFQHGFVYNSQVHCGELGLGRNLDIRWRLYEEITYIRMLPK